MTGIGRGSGGPPWSVDLLADLQAGALDPQQADELWPRVHADPEAQEILAALEATQADLREFAMAPAPPMPAHFAARLDAAIAAESQARAQAFIPQQQSAQQQSAPQQAAPPPPAAPVVNLDAARRKRNRGLGIGIGILAAAAAAVGIAFVALPGDGGGDGNVAIPTSNAPQQSGPLSFKSDELGKPQLEAARNQDDYGPFADKAKLSACLVANNLDGKADPLGGKQVTVDGKQGTLLVLVSGPGTFRLLVVGPDCGPGKPAKLAERTGVR